MCQPGRSGNVKQRRVHKYGLGEVVTNQSFSFKWSTHHAPLLCSDGQVEPLQQPQTPSTRTHVVVIGCHWRIDWPYTQLLHHRRLPPTAILLCFPTRWMATVSVTSHNPVRIDSKRYLTAWNSLLRLYSLR